MENSKCSVLVTSCDAYEDAWEPFFSLFKHMWPDCPFPVFLNTESKSYTDESLTIKSLHPENTNKKTGKPISWSDRLKQALQKIETDYVLFFLEDFFLMSPVRSDKVNECIRLMEENTKIGVIRFYEDFHLPEIIYDEFSKADPEYDYAISTMVSLWKKDFLISILRDENPWEFEFNGTARWRRTDIEILVHRSEFPLVFDYKVHPDFGYGIFQGKWLKKNVELFEKYGIKVDCEKRGFWEDLPDLHAREREKHWLWHDVQRTLKSPGMMFHYIKCTYDVAKDKARRLKAKYFNF